MCAIKRRSRREGPSSCEAGGRAPPSDAMAVAAGGRWGTVRAFNRPSLCCPLLRRPRRRWNRSGQQRPTFDCYAGAFG